MRSMPMPSQVVDRRRQADGARDVRRARLELPRQLVVGGLLERHRQDHVAAALPRRHRLEQLLAAVQHADAGRAEHLVAGEAVEIAAERLHVDHARAARPARRRAAPGRRAACAHRDESLHRHDRAERIGDVREREQAWCADRSGCSNASKSTSPVCDDRDHLQLRAGLLAHAAATARCWRGAPARRSGSRRRARAAGGA